MTAHITTDSSGRAPSMLDQGSCAPLNRDVSWQMACAVLVYVYGNLKDMD